MTRKECLDAAAGCVLKDRQNQYGGPENNFERIAQMWNGYLGTNSIKPWDVAAMMGMLKMARARFNPKYADNWVDMAGYAACGIECATAQEEFDKALDEAQRKSMEHMFKKAEGGKQEFKPGDRVQVRIPTADGDRWDDAVCVSILPEGTGIRVDYGDFNAIAFGWRNIRHAPKAEGCEDLVEKDAHQTKEELFQHIVDCNPANYKPRNLWEGLTRLNIKPTFESHKATGEELAEMAEEEDKDA